MARTGLQKGIKKADTFQYPFLFFYNGRGDRIRTYDPLHPMQVLYQTELHPDMSDNITDNIIKNNIFYSPQCFFIISRVCSDIA